MPAPVSVREVLRVALPSSLAMVTGYAMQIVDNLFIGRLGPLALGGAALGTAVISILLVVSLGALSGLDYLMAHAHGSRNADDGRRFFSNGMILATVLGLLSVVIVYLLADGVENGGGFYRLFGVAPDLAEQAAIFLRPMSWTLLPFFIFHVQRVYLQSRSIVVPAMIILLLANVINAAGNWLFVLGKPIGPIQFTAYGIAGSGYSTGVARLFMMFSLLGYLAWHRHKLDLSLPLMDWADRFRPEIERFKNMIRLGAPASFQLLFEVGVFSGATLFAGRLGENALAAHQIALQIASATFMLPLGISMAASSLVGQRMGASDRDGARKVGGISLALGAGVMTVCAALVMLCGPYIARCFTQSEAVLEIAIPLLGIVGFFQIFDGTQAVATGALRGAGNTLASAIANLVGHWGVGLPLGLSLAFWFHWGVYGIWIGLSVGLILVATSLLWFWRRWMR